MTKILFFCFVFLVSNFGWGQFGEEIPLSGTLVKPYRAITMDVNGDSMVDVISSAYNQYQCVLSYYENLGGEFTVRQDIGQNVCPRAQEKLDVDLDGDLDIIATSSDWANKRIVWFENFGGGKFSNEHLISTQTASVFVLAVGDLDNDGDEDICYETGTGQMVWVSNQGNGTFSSENVIDIGMDNVFDLDVADLDNDGDLDIFTVETWDGRIVWFENLGGGTFSTKNIITNSLDWAYSVNAADLDGDGDLEILAQSHNPISKVVYFDNLGSGNFGPEMLIQNSVGGWYADAIDLDGDLDQDIVAVGNGVWLLENTGGGTFAAGQMISTDSIGDATFVLFEKIDGDTLHDIVVVNEKPGKVYWIKNNGNLSFDLELEIGSYPENLVDFEVKDMDNDGDLDMITGSRGDAPTLSPTVPAKVSIYENIGSQKFKRQRVIGTSIYPGLRDIEINDLDGDGLLDIVYVNFNDHEIAWYKNIDGINYSGPIIITDTVINVQSVSSGDYDQDGDIDLVVGSKNSTATEHNLSYLKNDGNGLFSFYQLINSKPHQRSIESGDYDSDGDLDILVSFSISNDTVSWFENVGGDFINEHFISDISGPERSSSIDIDGDGDLDVYIESDLYLVVAENLGGGNFAPVDTVVQMSSNTQHPACFVDLNMDGLQDAVVDGGTSENIFWMENLGNFTFGSPVVFRELTVPKILRAVDIDQDGDEDVIYGSAEDEISWFKNSMYDVNQIRGTVFVDINQSGTFDSVDVTEPWIQVLSTPQNQFGYTFSNGHYHINLGDNASGWYEVYPNLLPNWHITTDSLTYHVFVDSQFVFSDSADYGIAPNSLVDSVNVNLTSASTSCLNSIVMWLTTQNVGTTILNGILHLELDTAIDFSSAEIPPDSIVANNYYWNLDSLSYFQQDILALQVMYPGAGQLGDTLISVYTFIGIDSLGIQNILAIDTLQQIASCAYDPNDKIADPIGVDSIGLIPLNTSLVEYTIRFQNTGNATAQDVVIEDQLDSNLIWSSLVPLASSHSMVVDVSATGNVSYIFDNIMLPDSVSNEPESHGFVKYRIDVKPGLQNGTQFYNQAAIYFDQNPAIITNQVVHTLYDCGIVTSQVTYSNLLCKGESIYFHANDNQPGVNYSWIMPTGDTLNGSSVIWVTDTAGSLSFQFEVSNGLCSASSNFVITIYDTPSVTLNQLANDTICEYMPPYNLTATPSGGTFSGTGVSGNTFDPSVAGQGSHTLYYSYTDGNGCEATDSITIDVNACLGLESNAFPNLTIYPNPFSDFTTISFGQELNGGYNIRIVDVLGKEVYARDQVTGSQIQIHKDQLGAGVYLFSIFDNSSGEEVFNAKLVVE